MPVGSDFIEICEAQIEVLFNGLGASLCIVYLTDNSLENNAGNLVPVIVRPENLTSWAQSDLLIWLEQANYLRRSATPLPDSSFPQNLTVVDVVEGGSTESAHGLALNKRLALSSDQHITHLKRSPDVAPSIQTSQKKKIPDGNDNAIAPLVSEFTMPAQNQIALPLVYKGIMVGLLVTARPDRVWTEHEHHQIEQIVRTISVACVVDQRERWLENRLQHQSQKQLQDHQHDVFDDLIHQFRNPLTALRTFGKLLMRRLQPSDRNFGVAESIVRESDRLQEMLHQFKVALEFEPPELEPWEGSHTPSLLEGSVNSSDQSTLSNIPPERLFTEFNHSEHPTIDVSSSATYLTGHDISTVPCNLEEVLSPLLNVAWAIAQDHDIELHVELSPRLSPVLADLRGLQEVLSNLIDNAIKYTPPGGHVLIRVLNQITPRQAIIIADTGLGIPELDQVHLFERHFRGVQADGKIPGTGLGLAIAHGLITKMNGEIEVFSPVAKAPQLNQWKSLHSEYPGTAFIVWLEKATDT